MKTIKSSFVTILIVFICLLAACKTLPQKEEIKKPIIISRRLTAKGIITAPQLASFFLQNNEEQDPAHILKFAQYYIDEAAAENINSDIAFIQMCLETGFLRFGGLVQPEWHNYCGLGAISKEQPGCIFETEELGVRAHIQHLQAYATTEDIPLKKELVDPRYNWVHKTKFALTMGDMARSWAADPEYACKLEKLLERLEESAGGLSGQAQQ